MPSSKTLPPDQLLECSKCEEAFRYGKPQLEFVLQCPVCRELRIDPRHRITRFRDIHSGTYFVMIAHPEHDTRVMVKTSRGVIVYLGTRSNVMIKHPCNKTIDPEQPVQIIDRQSIEGCP